MLRLEKGQFPWGRPFFSQAIPLPNAIEDTFEAYIVQNFFKDDPFENMSDHASP
jgi:hypothetical protein